MRREILLKALAVLATAGSFPVLARPAANLRMLIPADAGTGWDTTGRALGSALQEAGAAGRITYDNHGGAAGTLGLAQFINSAKGDPGALMVMGATMLGGIIAGRPPVHLSQATPVARVSTGYNVLVLPAGSALTSMAGVIAQLKKDPGSVRWGGDARGSTAHIAASLIAAQAGVDPSRISYIAYRSAREATADLLAAKLTIASGGYCEFFESIATGRITPVAVTSGQRLEGVAVPTLKELGIDVDIGDWRGVYGAPGLRFDQREALVGMVTAALKTRSWQVALQKNSWTPAVLTGAAFDRFVDAQFAALRATMVKSGMV